MLQLPSDASSPWHRFHHEPMYPPLQEGMSVDAVIIGAGIAGLTTAYLLRQAGLSVAVLEKSTIGSGTTGHTTGKVTSQHGITYTSLAQRHGKEAAMAYGEANEQAIEIVDAIVSSERIDCDWQRDDNYVFTTDSMRIDEFKTEAKLAAELNLPASFVSETPLPFKTEAAVKFSNQGKIHSLKYVLGLANALVKNGGHVFEATKAANIRDGAPGRVWTSKGMVVAKHIVVATKVPTWPLIARGSYCLLEYPTESFGVAGKLASDLQGMYISPDKDHYSVLPIDTEEGKSLIIVGAGGNLPGFRGRDRAKGRQERLARYAQTHFDVTEWQHRWAAYDYISYDEVPLVGKLYPWSKNLYVATAFRKWGLSNGTAAAMILRDRILKKANRWANTYDSLRLKPVRSIPGAVARYLRGN